MSVDALWPFVCLWLILFAITMSMLLVVFLVHFFVPKAMLRTYFCEPYFSPFEVEFFTGAPFAYIRTVMFMRLAGWPESGRKRGLTEAYKLAPMWFRYLSKFVVGCFITSFSLFLLLMVFLWPALHYATQS